MSWKRLLWGINVTKIVIFLPIHHKWRSLTHANPQHNKRLEGGTLGPVTWQSEPIARFAWRRRRSAAARVAGHVTKNAPRYSSSTQPDELQFGIVGFSKTTVFLTATSVRQVQMRGSVMKWWCDGCVLGSTSCRQHFSRLDTGLVRFANTLNMCNCNGLLFNSNNDSVAYDLSIYVLFIHNICINIYIYIYIYIMLIN